MTFTLTPHGVLAHIPVVTFQGRVYADLSWSTAEVAYGHTSRWRWEGVARILLILLPYSHNPDRSRPSYTVGYLYFGKQAPTPRRTVGRRLSKTRNNAVEGRLPHSRSARVHRRSTRSSHRHPLQP
ncbi:hypothetical protein K466DRAFT_588853 [Polyporus arcularius HHB13444]|uniref:Uncharacterized protein n=1 Tax=Polyporus arcularius HHB13444 TaxID=1314778 RepID=A0A5C3P4Y7_9APHY|nr:hypothetical protein K466DRAFT_588853 [Polyporus arcularius HHB13444]